MVSDRERRRKASLEWEATLEVVRPADEWDEYAATDPHIVAAAKPIQETHTRIADTIPDEDIPF